MKRFIKRIIIFSIPLALFVLLYIYLDPFKVIKEYDVYLSDYVMLHRGFISTKVYIKNRESQHYNSFILGSSRSCAHTGKEWQKYLPKTAKTYSYGSWNENIIGIYKKLRLIDSLNDPILNAFIVFDDKTFSPVSKDFLKKEHYLVSGDNKLYFHLYYFTRYFDWKLLLGSIDYKLFGKKRNYMNSFQGMKKGDLNPINNDWYRDKFAEEDSAEYYKKCLHKFYNRPTSQQYFPVKIDQDEKEILNKIKAILNKHNTDYKIIIAPLYDQLKINPKDLEYLNEIFGENKIFDYSGINEITNNIYNYNNDVKHYRYKVGDKIFKDIYSNNSNSID